MTTLYLVQGYAGEYDGRREWPVAVHHTEASAQRHCDYLNEQMGIVQELDDATWREIHPDAENPDVIIPTADMDYWDHFYPTHQDRRNSPADDVFEPAEAIMVRRIREESIDPNCSHPDFGVSRYTVIDVPFELCWINEQDNQDRQ